MRLRTKGEQKAYLDGFEMCAECIEKYLSDEGKQKLECLLMAVRNAVKIEDIEQQPCEDAVNRQAVNDLVDELARAISDERCYISRGRATGAIMSDIINLPPFTPKGKTGHWYIRETYPLECESWECSECKEVVYEKTKYCPNCGARMTESEDKE